MAAKIILNDEQKDAFKAIQKFIEHPAVDTFVLKGYAGTGKTFLMQHLAKWLKEYEHEFSLLASTGRAATILRGKTGFNASTVHSELYRFNRVDGDEEGIPEDAPIDQYGQMTLQFGLREPDNKKVIYIVDESSMLSSEIAKGNETVFFGSGYLMDDFFNAVGSNKVIFVGDPGQLPPIGQLLSPALDMEWLAKNRRTAISITLNKIERHSPDNDILLLASMVRTMHEAYPNYRFPKIRARNLNSVVIYPDNKNLFNSYVQKFREVGANGTLAIARTNRMVNDINRATRRDLYGGLDMPIQVGDVLMVIHNNYTVPLTNGDFVIVIDLGEQHIQAGLGFQNVKVKALASDNDFELLLSLDILYGKEGNFTKGQLKALMVDFSKRMKKKQIKPNSDEYKIKMMSDKYLNCLRVKYGYGVTCHKAQGGEWSDVFLFLEKGMYRMKPPELVRWLYTAVTRAKEKLHLSNNWWIA